MRTFAFAILAFAVSASSLNVGPCGVVYQTDCRELEPAPLCKPEKVCSNVCTDITTFVTKWDLKKKCTKECVQRTRQVPTTIQKEQCEDVCVTKFRPVTKYR